MKMIRQIAFLLVVGSQPAASVDFQLRQRHSHNENAELSQSLTQGDPFHYVKIQQCFGDCDSSGDCEDGLVCYHRDLDDPIVPGCSAHENVHLNTTNSVCVVPTPTISLQQERTQPVIRNLLGLCRGDCDGDSDCEGSLVCHQRTSGDPVPGCGGKDLRTSRDYCAPSQKGVIMAGRDSRKFDLCEGDCDSDNDCSGDLVCYQREENDPLPRGCNGRRSWRTDFCVRPGTDGDRDDDDDDGTGSSSSSSPFRLKIYWEEGYDWQDEYFERKWCLTRDYNVGGTCWHGLSRRTCSEDRVYVTRCSRNDDDPKQRFNFEWVNSEEVLIKVHGQNRCLSRSGIDIELRSCNSGSSSQRFYAPNGSLTGYRFELSQKNARRYCLNQDHHPKGGEYVQMFPCSWTRARDSLTSYWERY